MSYGPSLTLQCLLFPLFLDSALITNRWGAFKRLTLLCTCSICALPSFAGLHLSWLRWIIRFIIKSKISSSNSLFSVEMFAWWRHCMFLIRVFVVGWWFRAINHQQSSVFCFFLFSFQTLAEQLTDKELEEGRLYPPLSNIREVSVQMAVKARKSEIFQRWLAIDKPINILKDLS